MNHPHPSGKGRGGAAAAGICSVLAGALAFEPTSLMRGEGLPSRWLHVFERVLRQRGGRVVVVVE
jgi:hypothetical protein